MSLTNEKVIETIDTLDVSAYKLQNPLSQYIASTDIIEVADNSYKAIFKVELPPLETVVVERLLEFLEEQLASIGIIEVNLHIVQPKPTEHGQQVNQPRRFAHPKITRIIAVASGKGGVGKSTSTVNLSLVLKKLGYSVGILDADIYGPSIPTMLGIADKSYQMEHDKMVPINAFDMPVMSIANVLPNESTPVAWRGIKATGALLQLFNQTNWPELDYLLIDLPPGTGDIQLTLAQKMPISGSIIITTPQNIALLDAQKGINLFKKLNIPIIGVVENMSLHTCSQCGHQEEVFGQGGGEALCDEHAVPLLGKLPLDKNIRDLADKGTPAVLSNTDIAEAYLKVAQKMIDNEKRLKLYDNESNRFF